MGWIKRPFAARLADFPEVFTVGAAAVALAPGLDGFDNRSAAVDDALRRLAETGCVPGWRDEMYPVAPRFGAAPWMQMERATVPLFSIRAWGVHVNGFIRKGAAVEIWIARCAVDKLTFPGMLDNFVAGGQPIGLGVMENVIKECGEEAGVPPALAACARPVSAISYCRETADGIKPDVQFVFDLELPPDFEPHAADGEIDEFMLWPATKVMATTAETNEFKFNCNLVNIDFLVRHGLIGPDYLDIVAGLHR